MFFTYRGSNIPSTESSVNIRLAKVWISIDSLSIIWVSNLSDKIKWDFFKAVAVSVLLYRCTIWTLTKRAEESKIGTTQECCERFWKNSWEQHPTKQQVFGHLPPISKMILVKRTQHAEHCWKIKDELIREGFFIDPNTWTWQSWTTSKNLFTVALCGNWIDFGRLARSDGL